MAINNYLYPIRVDENGKRTLDNGLDTATQSGEQARIQNGQVITKSQDEAARAAAAAQKATADMRELQKTLNQIKGVKNTTKSTTTPKNTIDSFLENFRVTKDGSLELKNGLNTKINEDRAYKNVIKAINETKDAEKRRNLIKGIMNDEELMNSKKISGLVTAMARLVDGGGSSSNAGNDSGSDSGNGNRNTIRMPDSAIDPRRYEEMPYVQEVPSAEDFFKKYGQPMVAPGRNVIRRPAVRFAKPLNWPGGGIV